MSSKLRIETESPLRVDLAGGTLDMWPIWAFLGEATTINFAISLFARVRLVPRDDSKVIFCAFKDSKFSELELELSFDTKQDFLKHSNSMISLVQVAYQFFFSAESELKSKQSVEQGFEISIQSDSPRGAGLGGSSALLISLLKAFFRWKNHLDPQLPLPSTSDWVTWAHHLEAQVLMTPTGVQDYVPPLLGGICESYFSAAKTTYRSFDRHELWLDYIKERMILVYTGAPHHSGINNFEVLSRLTKKEAVALQAIQELSNLSSELSKILTQENPDGWNGADFFKRENSARLKLSPVFSSPEIEKILFVFLKDPNIAVKICGAGGGGCVMIWVNDPALRGLAVKKCQELGFSILPCSAVGPRSTLD